MAKPQPATRIRTCRSCGTRYEYPLRSDPLATRHHCATCAPLPESLRKIGERLLLRIQNLERELVRAKAPSAPVGETSPPAESAGGES